MLKIRPMIIGVVTTVVVFAVLLLGECLISDKLENNNEALLTGFGYVFILMSVFAGAFVSAMTAKGRGLIYGAVLSSLFAAIMLILYFVMGGTELGVVLMRALGCVPAGVVGGAAGILISNKNEYV